MSDGFDYSAMYFGESASASMARRDAEAAEDEAYWEKCAREQHEISLKIANRHILEVAAERTAFHDLAQAMVYELYGDPASRDLTIPDNKDGRRAFFEKRKAEAAEASEAANANAKYI